jgi:uncharacterized protein YjbJ (UPF0337 family)
LLIPKARRSSNMKKTKETMKGYVNNAVGKVKEATG